MLKESIEEILEAARLCIQYKKTSPKWEIYSHGGNLAHPASLLLFSIIDDIGRHYKLNKNLEIIIDNERTFINGEDWEHFKVLNSKYFNQDLTPNFIKALHNKFQDRLTNNSKAAKKTQIFPANSYFEHLKLDNVAFATSKDYTGNEIYLVFVKELFGLCEKAVEEFKKDLI